MGREAEQMTDPEQAILELLGRVERLEAARRVDAGSAWVEQNKARIAALDATLRAKAEDAERRAAVAKRMRVWRQRRRA
jgi:hypothetical protein